MANVIIPVRFKRITEAFDDDARARLCQSSSGSDHSSVTDLSDLVDSFLFEEAPADDDRNTNNNIINRDCFDDNYNKETLLDDINNNDVENFFGTDPDTKEMLADLLQVDAQDRVIIVNEVSDLIICQNMDGILDDGFKRRLMTMLRTRGFDAGLCKSRWEKTGRHPAGEYEYIDIVISNNNRYIVEVSLGSEFTIARPTKTYQSLLDMIPKITVIKTNELKQVTRLMCAAMRASLKSRDMLVSPWRKNGYMQKKWFSSFKRTTNALPVRSPSSVLADDRTGESFLSFEFLPVVGCRKEVGRTHVVSNLKTLMLSGMS
uniref:uncharacterized protein LOC122596728 n=1 Tax=Erigeron canadensis TaxID=72917 RepID=UPI001CB9AEA6|nr:uncharacterized protein LOC122596728 [Erigeron canadensis]